MKSLVFNLLVVGALAFLLFDGKPPASVRDAVDRAAVKAEMLFADGKAMVGKPTAQSEAKPARPATPKQVAKTPADTLEDEKVVATVTQAPAAPVAKTPDAKEPVAKAPVINAPKPVTKTPRARPSSAKSTEVATALAPKLDPAVAKRRAEVLGGASDATFEFMAPRVRRSELQRLAEDMELMFVEKATR